MSIKLHFIPFYLLLISLWGVSPDASAFRLADGVTVEDYNAAGVKINDTLSALSKKLSSDPEAIELAFHPEFLLLEVGEPHYMKADEYGIQSGERKADTVHSGVDAAMAWFKGLAHKHSKASSWQFKLVEILEITKELEVEASFRYEVGSLQPDGTDLNERGHFLGRFRLMNQAQLLVAAKLTKSVLVRGPGTLFVEKSTEAGLDYFGHEDVRFLPPSDALKFQTSRHSIGGVTAGDFDGDGWDDVFLVGGGEAKLFINQHNGQFIDQTEEAQLDGISHVNTAVLADFDNDGDGDLFLSQFIGGIHLYRNDEGVFTDITREAGLGSEELVSVASAADLNNDGLLDLYLGRMIDIRESVPEMIHYARNGETNVLYINKGGLVFEDKSKDSGADDHGLALGLAIADYDLDGDQDIYVANDFGRNVFLKNQGNGRFEDVAKENGTLAISGGMSASFGDYDNDGLLDIYVSSIRSNQRWFSQDINVRSYVMNLVQSKRRKNLLDTFLDLREHLGDDWEKVGQHELAGNYLLRNKGDGTFEDVSDTSGTRVSGWYWGSGFVDVNSDGFMDIYAANGWITGEKEHDL